jgi:DNA-binding response OmpR family regulator
MPRVLLIDSDQQHAERVREQLGFHAVEVEVIPDPRQAVAQLKRDSADYAVVILNVSSAALPWADTLAKLQESCLQPGAYPPPLFLCTSDTKRPPEFELRIERMGARYVYEG